VNDEKSISALLSHARALRGASLADLAESLGVPVPAGSRIPKGWAGRLVEQELGAEGSFRGPDFTRLGIELKTVPVREDFWPLESTAVCHIDPVVIAGESWATSYVRQKLQHVLFIALACPKAPHSIGDRHITGVRLWNPSLEEERLLQTDFEYIVRNYFRQGRAHALTGHVGKVLQVRPKGRNRADMQGAYDADGNPSRLGRCGFYLRPAFVCGILRAREIL